MKENKLIAEFLGKDHELNQCISAPAFHKSWDWLMPVVIECFERFGNTDNIDYMRLNDALLTCNIDELYNEVVEFINQYNKENESND